jgi:hypothetical protein
MTATRGFTFSTAVRMINRVHHHTTDLRTTSQPTSPSGFPQHDVAMFDIPNLAQGRHTLNGNFPYFTRRKTQLSPTIFTTT